MTLNLLELELLQRMNAVLQCMLLDKLAVWISFPGNGGLGFILLAILLLCFKKTRLLGAVMATALALDGLLVNVCLKPLIDRARPYELGVALNLITAHPNDPSFPSGHTAAAFAAAVALLPGPKKAYRGMLIYAALMGLSRLYLLMHYPTDVLAGAVCGVLCGLLAVKIWKPLLKQKGAER